MNARTRLGAVLASTALLFTGLSVAAPLAAQADTPGCVSQQEFKQVKKGLSIKKVHSIFDTKGRRDAISKGGGFTFEIRSYKSYTKYGAVSVGYTNGKLDTKSAVF